METFHETDGYYTHTVDSNLRLDTQTFVYQLNQPTPVPLNPVDKIDVKFGNFTNQQIMSIKWVSNPWEYQFDDQSEHVKVFGEDLNLDRWQET